MSQLINYLADNEGETYESKIKQFYQNDQQREEQDIWDSIDSERDLWLTLNEPSRRCKCNHVMWMGRGPLCYNCDLEEAEALVRSFHGSWEYPPAHKKGVAFLKEWGSLCGWPAYTIGVG